MINCGGLVKMMANPEAWCGPAKLREDSPVYDTPILPHADTFTPLYPEAQCGGGGVWEEGDEGK
jgi:hypothetical protein